MILPDGSTRFDYTERNHRENVTRQIGTYGRRRVGKTELILQFLKRKPGVCFLGKQAPAGEQIREFLHSPPWWR